GILAQPLTAPVGGIERRIGQDVIEAQVFQLVLVKTTLIIPSNIRIDATYRQVHLGQPPSGVVAFLAVDGDIADTAAMLLHQALALHAHAPGTAARVIAPAFVGLQHLDQDAHDRAWGVELPSPLALRPRKAAQEILIDAAKDILRLAPPLA